MPKASKENYQITISKLNSYKSLDQLKEELNGKMSDRHVIRSVGINKNKDCSVLYFSYIVQNQNKDVDWFRKWREFFTIQDQLRTSSITGHGVIIVELDGSVQYLISFGRSFSLLKDYTISNYGITMAGLLYDGNTIDSVSSKFFSLTKNKSIVIYTQEAEYDFEEGEAADLIKANIAEHVSRTEDRLIEKLLTYVKELSSVTYSNIKLTLSKEKIKFQDIVDVCKLLDAIECSYTNQFDIPQMQPVGKNLSEQLDNELWKKIKQEDESILFSIPFFNKDENDKYVFLDEIDTVILKYRKDEETFEQFSIKDLFAFVKRNSAIEKLSQIHCTLSTDTYSSNVSLIKWLEAQIEHEGQTYALYNGKWYTFNDRYLERVNDQIKQIEDAVVIYDANASVSKTQIDEFCEINKDEVITLFSPEKTTDFEKIYKEFRYNYYFAKTNSYLLYDRVLFDSAVEVCDISIPSESLIHCKIGDVGSLEECLRQSILGLMYYTQHTKEVLTKPDKFGNTMSQTDTIQVNYLSESPITAEFKISKIKSLKCKLTFLNWYQTCKQKKFTPKIVIANYKK